MFEPITTQKQFDERTSSRIRRERAKIHKMDSNNLQPIIDSIARIQHDLIQLQEQWMESELDPDTHNNK